MRQRSREQSLENKTSNGKLYIGNLSFQVQEQEIKEEFERLFGPVVGVKIIRKNVQGIQFKEFNYGFVHMQYLQHAESALKNFSIMSKQNWIVLTSTEKNKTKQNSNVAISESENSSSTDKRTLNKLLNGGVMVRELFVGNMMPNNTQKDLQINFGIYGEIENIEFFNQLPPFAFVKFKKVSHAQKAFDNQKTLSLLLQCSNLKLIFSDHEKRANIVGDFDDSNNMEDLTNFIYLGYSGQVPNELALRNELEKFVDVKDIYIKQAQFGLNGLRSYVFVELGSQEQVKKVFRRFQKEDRNNDKKIKLGDRRVDVQMVQMKDISNQNMQGNMLKLQQQNKMINNMPIIQNQMSQQPSLQQFNQQNSFNQNFQNNQMMQNNMVNQQIHQSNMFDQNIRQQSQQFQPAQQVMNPNLNKFENQQLIRNPTYEVHNNLPQINNLQVNQKQQNINQIYQQQNINPIQTPQNIPEKKQNNILDTIFDMVKTEPYQQKSNEKEEETKNAFWSGFFTRQKQFRVGIDAIVLEGQEPEFTEYNLNISHRINLDELIKKNAQCIAVFQPSNETQTSLFKGYIDYFQEKKRAGIINIQNLVLYIVPKCEEFKDFQIFKEDQILGIFCNSNEYYNKVNIKDYISQDFNQKLDDKNLDIQSQNIDLNLLNDVLPILENPEIMKLINEVN